MIPEIEKEKLRTETVKVLLTLRAEYLAQGANPLKHWTQLTNRLRGAARTSQTPEEWYTTMLRTLPIMSAPNLDGAACLINLVDHVRKLSCPQEWLDLVEQEYGLIIAMARKEAEQRQENARV